MKNFRSIFIKSLGKRGLLSLCLLRDLPVTISLENHGELTTHSRCSNYLPVAACGKKLAHDEKSHSQQNTLAALTVLQERENWAQAKEEKEESMRSNIPLSKDIQTENTMFYTSKKKKEELERYQDCSWFQRKPSKEEFTSKLSQAETLISPDFELNELDLEMQFASRDIPPWGDEYLEVFDGQDFHNEMDENFGEKENFIYPPNESSTYFNCKLGEDGQSDINNCNNYTIRKTDSYDNMRMISSTSLSDIIPISYQEQLNNANYNLHAFDKIKCEVKEEIEVASSPDSQNYVIESDDCDLNIGREEVIEVEIQNESHDVDVNVVKVLPNKLLNSDVGLEKPSEGNIAVDSMKVGPQELEYAKHINNPTVTVPVDFQAQEIKHENTDDVSYPAKTDKLDLKLELNKGTFDQPPINVPTPELDFMDLVNYINNEMLTDSVDTSNIDHIQVPNVSMPLKEASPNMVTTVPSKPAAPFSTQEHANSIGNEKFPKPASLKEKSGKNYSDLNTINTSDISDSLSIAERIKIGSTRKRPNRFSVENFESSDDEENYSGDGEKYEDEDEDEYCEEGPRRKKCRTRSSTSESSSRNGGDSKFETDSYRERRDKNNAASRRSRQNKKDKERMMYRSREEAERKNLVLKAKADKLEKLVIYLRHMLLQVVLKKKSGT